MKQEGVFDMKRVVVFIVLAMLVIGSCTAQSSNSAAQRFVGTWTDREGYNWVFGADGKLAYSNVPWNISEYRYSVFDGERGTVLTIFEAGGLGADFKDQAYNVDFSRDGKTLRLAGGSNFYGWSVAGPGWGTNELVRQTESSSQSNSESNALFSTTDTKLNGTWVDDDVGFERRFNNGQFEFSIDGYHLWKGTYTTSGGKLTTIDTHIGGGESEWYLVDNGVEATGDYSINGNQLILTFNGETITYTKKNP